MAAALECLGDVLADPSELRYKTRHVRKGETGTTIMRPLGRKESVGGHSGGEGRVEIGRPGEGTMSSSRVVEDSTAWAVAYVWNVAQTDGIMVAYRPPPSPPWTAQGAVEAVVEDADVRATSHESRMDRGVISTDKRSVAYAMEMLRAEMAAMMVGSRLQIGYNPSLGESYVDMWLKHAEEDEPDCIRKAAVDANRICEWLLRRHDARWRRP